MSTRRPKVLVVDDDDGLVAVLHRVLYQDNHRFDVLLAKNVEIALDILADVHVEVIVTDFQMPGKSGMDLLGWVARERPETRVILMTGFDTTTLRDRAHAFGCLRVMSKPFGAEEMRSTIHQALERRDGFGGTLSELSCIDVVQMLTLARKSTAIHFSAETSSGTVYVDRGDIVHAVWKDLVGEDALYAMMAVEKGAFHTAPIPLDVERTITAPAPYLLMEGARRLDESGHGIPKSEGVRGSSLPVRAGSQPDHVPEAAIKKSVPVLIDEGFAHLRAGKRDDARKAWEEALRLEPGNRLIEVNLRKLNGTPAPPTAYAAKGSDVRRPAH
jgi:DNA-binding response OmpR family regulator